MNNHRAKGFYPRGHKPPEPQVSSGLRTMYIARVTAVRPHENQIDVQVEGTGTQKNGLNVAHPYCGAGSGVVGFPEIGSLGVFAHTSEGDLPLAWLPADPFWSPQYQHVHPRLHGGGDHNLTSGQNIIGLKHRMLQPGAVGMYASKGAGALFDSDAEIEDGAGDYVRLRSADYSINLNAQVSRLSAAGVRTFAGYALRNNPILDYDAESPGVQAYRVRNVDGSFTTYMGDDLLPGSAPATEYRVEVAGQAAPGLALDEGENWFQSGSRDPRTVEFVMGNYIGNTPERPDEYGRFLLPAIYPNGVIKAPSQAFIPLTRDGGFDRFQRDGVAWGFRDGNTGYFLTDKQGARHEWLGARQEGPNQGVSHEIYAVGAKLEKYGSRHEDGLAWGALYAGDVDLTVIPTDDSASLFGVRMGLSIRNQGRTYIEAGGLGQVEPTYLVDLNSPSTDPLPLEDKLAFKYIKKVIGNDWEEVQGSKHLSTGRYIHRATGSYRSYVGGAKVEIATGEWSASSLGAMSLSSIQGIQASADTMDMVFATGYSNKVSVGTSSTEVLTGTIEEKITVAGSIEHSVLSGNISQSVSAGTITQEVSAGSITQEVSAGSITQSATSISSSGTASVKISSNALIQVDAPIVKLGRGLHSGVLTQTNHFCLVTGLPSALASTSVFAG